MGKKKSGAGRRVDVPPPAEIQLAEAARRVPGEAVAEMCQAQEAPRVFGEGAEMPNIMRRHGCREKRQSIRFC